LQGCRGLFDNVNAQVNRQKCEAFLSALNRQLGSTFASVALLAKALQVCFDCFPALRPWDDVIDFMGNSGIL
jgi:hypothetical protein